jgi:ABC-type amino acid transport substrate-binding protein
MQPIARSGFARLALATAGLLGAALCHAQAVATEVSAAVSADVPDRQNRFNDPFFQVSHAVPDCPEPAGPRVTAEEKLRMTHHRLERGGTCWLRGECIYPTAYGYDPDIAQALQDRLQQHNPFAADSTVWITVQGRLVYLEGCVRDPSQAAAWQAWVQEVPYVMQVITALTPNPAQRVPYKRLTDPL